MQTINDLRQNQNGSSGSKTNTNNPIPISILNTNTNTNNDASAVDKANVIESKARSLMVRLSAPESSLEFYCMVAWVLPESHLDYLANTAIEKGRNPGAYFNVIARKAIAKRKDILG